MVALIERDINDFMLLISDLADARGSHPDGLINSILSKLPSVLDDDRVALWVEVQAEAGRNRKIEQLTLSADQKFRELIRKIIAPVSPDFSQQEIDMRVEMLLVMTHSLGIYAGTHSLTDHEVIAAGVEFVLRAVLSPTRQAQHHRS